MTTTARNPRSREARPAARAARGERQVLIATILVLATGLPARPEERAPAGEAAGRADRLVAGVRTFAETVLSRGRDVYGKKHTPLFVDGLHARTLEPVRWQKSGQTWVLCNVASQQPRLRLLDGLTALTGEAKYRRAAEDATRHALKHLRTPNGLLSWGGHLAWDLEGDRGVGQYADVHELKGHQPYFRLMWRVDPAATRKLMETIWAAHVLDWSRLDYNRHASGKRPAAAKWGATFDEDIEVPFPAKGGNLSFVNVAPPLIHSGTMLAVLDANAAALTWTRRLVYRWQQGEHPKTGLCGGQVSYRKHDRARDALGHVHPKINEAKIVASYHQTCRYHQLPLSQMQAGEALIAAGGKRRDVGRQFIEWASGDLKAYAQRTYDPKTGQFVARMIDGTLLKWQQARTGYYTPRSFAPRRPDFLVLWNYTTAYRLTRDEAHWRMVGELLGRLGLGKAGPPDATRRDLRLDTRSTDWRAIYALLDLHEATGDRAFLRLAARIADNIVATRSPTGLFPRPGRDYARTGDEAPLAVLHVVAALRGKRSAMPRAVYDSRFFHCEYHGPLAKHQQKRADKRTYDNLVFYGGP